LTRGVAHPDAARLLKSSASRELLQRRMSPFGPAPRRRGHAAVGNQGTRSAIFIVAALSAGLSCADAVRPAGLHPFREFGSGNHRLAPATPGDILLHIRAEDMGLCFELAREPVLKLGDAAKVVDEVHGFRYFDQRAMIGFIDGTENPIGRVLVNATLIGEEDAAFAGESYDVTN